NCGAALLWRRRMGTSVRDAGVQRGAHIYAHCRRGVAGDVTLLVINTERTFAVILQLPLSSERYTLSAEHLQSAEVRLNGTALDLDPDDQLPHFAAIRSPAGSVELAPATITFLTIANAGNAACK